MTQDIYEVITQDLLEHNILRSLLEPLPLSDLIAQTVIVPLGVLLHEELEELEANWTPNYLPYYIDGVYMPATSTIAKNPITQSNLGTRRSRRKLEYTISTKTESLPF